ncbi:DUF7344 domain-containing protein [Haloprofundus halobius]|uniref:DUF7344 domain-containing protein n=1 Tax=Haloprofundus halobius TaxID=2876194 RepID=UPI001CCEFF1C|nr:hypothetical protein [Haloprofundus halobius]
MTTKTPSETSLFTRSVQYLVRLFTGSSNLRPQEDEDLPVTEILELIAPKRRQLILEELAAAEQTPLSTSTLAERVACAEYECSPEELKSDQRKRVYIALVQSHLPTYRDGDVVSYDPDSRLVDRGPEFTRVWQTYTAILESLPQ